MTPSDIITVNLECRDSRHWAKYRTNFLLSQAEHALKLIENLVSAAQARASSSQRAHELLQNAAKVSL
jgi:hypothetical protein